MDRSLDVGHVADTLPDLAETLEDERLRPFGLVGGVLLLVIGAVLSVAPATGEQLFWSKAVAATLVFVGVPLFCLGLAAPEPTASRYFQFGIDLEPKQRQAVATGAFCITIAPIVMAAGLSIGLDLLVLVTAATIAFVGASLVLTGFIAWTAAAIAEPEPA